MRGLWGDIEIYFCFGDVAKIKLTFYALQGIKRVKSKSRTAALGGSREGGYSQKEVFLSIYSLSFSLLDQFLLVSTFASNFLSFQGLELALPGGGWRGCGG